MTTHTLLTDAKTYARLRDNRQQFLVFDSNYLKTKSTVELGDVIVINTESGANADLFRKVTHTEEISEGVIAALIPHQMAKITQAFAPQGGYTGAFH